MIRRPPRSTLSSSSAASDVYKRQAGHHEPEHQGERSIRTGRAGGWRPGRLRAGRGRRPSQARSGAVAKSNRTRASPAVQTATATSRPAVTTSIAPYWYTGGGPMPKARATMNGVAATDSTCKPRACWNARKAVAAPSWPVAASARTTAMDATGPEQRARHRPTVPQRAQEQDRPDLHPATDGQRCPGQHLSLIHISEPTRLL